MTKECKPGGAHFYGWDGFVREGDGSQVSRCQCGELAVRYQPSGNVQIIRDGVTTDYGAFP